MKNEDLESQVIVNRADFTYKEVQELIKTVCAWNWNIQELSDTVLNLSTRKYKTFTRRMTSVLQNIDAINDLLEGAKSEEENE